MARLYKWYIEKKNKANSDSVLWARGVVSGHIRLPDGMFIHTSAIVSVSLENETVIIQTLNTRFECKMEDADYEKFTETNMIERFAEFKEKYDIPKVKYEPDLKANEVLLVLGNNRQYYFDSYHVNYQGKKSLYTTCLLTLVHSKILYYVSVLLIDAVLITDIFRTKAVMQSSIPGKNILKLILKIVVMIRCM